MSQTIVEVMADLIFDRLYSDFTDKHLEIEDIKGDSYDGVPGYRAVADHIAQSIYDEVISKMRLDEEHFHHAIDDAFETVDGWDIDDLGKLYDVVSKLKPVMPKGE